MTTSNYNLEKLELTEDTAAMNPATEDLATNIMGVATMIKKDTMEMDHLIPLNQTTTSIDSMSLRNVATTTPAINLSETPVFTKQNKVTHKDASCSPKQNKPLQSRNNGGTDQSMLVMLLSNEQETPQESKMTGLTSNNNSGSRGGQVAYPPIYHQQLPGKTKQPAASHYRLSTKLTMQRDASRNSKLPLRSPSQNQHQIPLPQKQLAVKQQNITFQLTQHLEKKLNQSISSVQPRNTGRVIQEMPSLNSSDDPTGGHMLSQEQLEEERLMRLVSKKKEASEIAQIMEMERRVRALAQASTTHVTRPRVMNFKSISPPRKTQVGRLRTNEISHSPRINEPSADSRSRAQDESGTQLLGNEASGGSLELLKGPGSVKTAVLHPQPRKSGKHSNMANKQREPMIVEHPIVLIPRDSSEGTATATVGAGDPRQDQMRQRFETQAITPVSNTLDVDLSQSRIGPTLVVSPPQMKITEQVSGSLESPSSLRPSQLTRPPKKEREVLHMKNAIIMPEDDTRQRPQRNDKNKSGNLDFLYLDSVAVKTLRKKSPASRRMEANETSPGLADSTEQLVLTASNYKSSKSPTSTTAVKQQLAAARQSNNHTTVAKASNIFESMDKRTRESHDKNRVHLNLPTDINQHLQKFNIRLTEQQRDRKSPRSNQVSELLDHTSSARHVSPPVAVSQGDITSPVPQLKEVLEKEAEYINVKTSKTKALKLREPAARIADVEAALTSSSAALEGVMVPGTSKYPQPGSQNTTHDLRTMIRTTSVTNGQEPTSPTGSGTLPAVAGGPSKSTSQPPSKGPGPDTRLGVAQIFADALGKTQVEEIPRTVISKPKLKSKVLQFPPVILEAQGATPGQAETAHRSEVFASFAGRSEGSGATMDKKYTSTHDNRKTVEIAEMDISTSLEIVNGPVRAPFKISSRRQSTTLHQVHIKRSQSRGRPTRVLHAHAQRVMLEQQQSESTASMGQALGLRGATLHAAGRGGASAVMTRVDGITMDDQHAASAELSQDLRHVIDDPTTSPARSPPQQQRISPQSQKYFEKNFSTIMHQGSGAAVGDQLVNLQDNAGVSSRQALPASGRGTVALHRNSPMGQRCGDAQYNPVTTEANCLSTSQPEDEASQETAHAEHSAQNTGSNEQTERIVAFPPGSVPLNFEEGIHISVSNVALQQMTIINQARAAAAHPADPRSVSRTKKVESSLGPFKGPTGPVSPPDLMAVGKGTSNANNSKAVTGNAATTPTSVEKVPKGAFKQLKDRERDRTISKLMERRQSDKSRSAIKDNNELEVPIAKSLHVGRVPSPRTSREDISATVSPSHGGPIEQSPNGQRSFDLQAAESGEGTQPLVISKKALIQLDTSSGPLSRTRGEFGGASAREVICFKLLGNEQQQPREDTSPERRMHRRLTGMPSSHLMTEKSQPNVGVTRLHAVHGMGRPVLEQVTSASKHTSEGGVYSPALPQDQRTDSAEETITGVVTMRGVIGSRVPTVKVPRTKILGKKETRSKVSPRERPIGVQAVNQIQIQFQPNYTPAKDSMNETMRTTLRSTAFGGLLNPVGIHHQTISPPRAPDSMNATQFTAVEALTPRILATNIGEAHDSPMGKVSSSQWHGLQQSFGAHQLLIKQEAPQVAKKKMKNEYLQNFQSRRELVELRHRKTKLQQQQYHATTTSPRRQSYQRYANETCVTLENYTPGGRFVSARGRPPRSDTSSADGTEEVHTQEAQSMDSTNRGAKGFNLNRAIKFTKLSKERREQIQLSLSLQEASGSREVMVREESHEETTNEVIVRGQLSHGRRGSGELDQWNDRRRSNGSLNMCSTAAHPFAPGTTQNNSNKVSIAKMLGTNSSSGGEGLTLGGAARSNVQLVDAGAQMTAYPKAADLAAVSSSEEGAASQGDAPMASAADHLIRSAEKLVLNHTSEKIFVPGASSGSATAGSPNCVSKELLEQSRTMSGNGFGANDIIEGVVAEPTSGVTPQPSVQAAILREATASAGGRRQPEPLSNALADNVTHATIIEEVNSADVSRTGEGHNVGVGVTELSVQLGSAAGPSRMEEADERLENVNLQPIDGKGTLRRVVDQETELSQQSGEDGGAPSAHTIPLGPPPIIPISSPNIKPNRMKAVKNQSQRAHKLNISTVSIDYEDLMQPDPAYEAAQENMRIRSRASRNGLLGNSAQRSFDSSTSNDGHLFGAQRRISRDETLKQQLRDYLNQKAEPRAATLHEVIDNAKRSSNRSYVHSLGGPNDAVLKGALLQPKNGRMHPFASVLGNDEELDLLKSIAGSRPQIRYVKRAKNRGYWERKKGHARGGASVPVDEQIISPYSQEYERLCLLYSGPRKPTEQREDEAQRRLQALLLKHTRRIGNTSRNQFSGSQDLRTSGAATVKLTSHTTKAADAPKDFSLFQVSQKQVLDLVIKSPKGRTLEPLEHVKMVHTNIHETFDSPGKLVRRRSSRVVDLYARNMDDVASKNTLLDQAGQGSQMSDKKQFEGSRRSPSEMNNDTSRSKVFAQGLTHQRQHTIGYFSKRNDMIDEATSAHFASSYGGVGSQPDQTSGGITSMRLSPVGSLDKVNRKVNNAFNIAISGESGLLKQYSTIEPPRGKRGGLRTVKQVLNAMTSQNPTALRVQRIQAGGKEHRNVAFGAKRHANEFGSSQFAPATTLLAAGTSMFSPRDNADLGTLRSPVHGDNVTRMTSQTGGVTIDCHSSVKGGTSPMPHLADPAYTGNIRRGETFYYNTQSSPFTPMPAPSGEASMRPTDGRVLKLPDVFAKPGQIGYTYGSPGDVTHERPSPNESPLDQHVMQPREANKSHAVTKKQMMSKTNVKGSATSAERRPESKSILVVHGADSGNCQGGGSRRVSPLDARGHISGEKLDPLDVIIDSQQSKHRRRVDKGHHTQGAAGGAGDTSDGVTGNNNKDPNARNKAKRTGRPSPSGANSKMTAASRHQKKVAKHLQQVKSAMSSHAQLISFSAAQNKDNESSEFVMSQPGGVAGKTGGLVSANARGSGMINQDSQTAFADLGPDPLV